MRGLSKRKGSDVWQGRFHIPTDIWRHRARLIAAGQKISKVQNYTLSLGERDQRKAEKAYIERQFQHEIQMEAWAGLLKELDRIELSGAPSLTHEQKAGLIRHFMEDFLARYRSDPASMPPLLESGRELPSDWEERYRSLPGEDRKALSGLMARFARGDSGERREALQEIRQGLAEGKPWAFPLELVWRDVLKAPEAETILAKLRPSEVQLSEADGVEIFLAGMRQLATVRHALEEAREYRYVGLGEVEKQITAMPTFKPVKASKGRKALDLFELLEEKGRVEGKRPATISAYKTSIERFKSFAGHSDPDRITKDDVLRWRNAMMEEGLDTATINKKHLAALKSVLKRALDEGQLATNVADGILDRTAQKQDWGKKTGLSWDEVDLVLSSTFNGTRHRPGLTLPYKRGLFWIPWVLAYTGLRPIEAAQLRAEDVRQSEEGTPFLFVTPEAGTTKGGNAWITGIHKHLIELGFLRMAEAVGSGPLFYNAYPPEIAELPTTRQTEAYSVVNDWMRDELRIEAHRGRRVHAFRHTVTTLSRGGSKKGNSWGRLNKEIRDYMMGSRSDNDAREGYGEYSPEAVDLEINKLPRFEVIDTGERPY